MTPVLVWCGVCRRIREVLLDAPWSNFDLMASLITFWIGVYLFLSPWMFSQIGGVYAAMAEWGTEWAWGGLFMALGGVGLLTVLWCIAPKFPMRLLARMGVAFCLVTFALNNLSYHPKPPLSTVTYVFLSLWSLWGILRTQSNGR